VVIARWLHSGQVGVYSGHLMSSGRTVVNVKQMTAWWVTVRQVL
jgi:hypothetical protein